MSQRPTAAGAEPGPTLGVRALASLREAPATVPALAAIVLFIVWGSDHAGYPVTHWSPGGLIILVLLLMGIGIIGLRLSEIPLAVRVSLACLAAYTALSYLSILWANVAGDAWEGANRTLVYLLVFALFACWRQRGPTAALLLLCWTSAMIVLAAYAALHLNAAGTDTALMRCFPEGRLNYPSGYPNANAAQWLMAFWPALLMARSERLPAALRGFLAGGAVLLADVALLSQSRGSIYATPVMIILVLAFLPGRMRSLGMLVAVAAGVGARRPDPEGRGSAGGRTGALLPRSSRGAGELPGGGGRGAGDRALRGAQQQGAPDRELSAPRQRGAAGTRRGGRRRGGGPGAGSRG